MLRGRLVFGICAAAGAAVSWASAQTVVDLGAAARYAVLGGPSIANTGATVVNGDLGVSPGTSISGFAGYAPGGPGIVNGQIHGGDSNALQAASSLNTAYNDAAGQTPTVTGLATLANTTLGPGVYNAPATLGISGVVTLDGHGLANPVFIFQTGTTLGTADGSQILLTNGANAQDVFWQVGSSATLGADSSFAGNLLVDTTITFGSGVTMEGRALAAGAVSLNSDVISAVPEPAETALIMGACAALLAVWSVKRSGRATAR
jgi:hypothetical protein